MPDDSGLTLERIQELWGWAYEISEEYGGLYRVARRDNCAATFTDTLTRLRIQIHTDYSAKLPESGLWP
jgi:hypothetical protein